MSSLANQQQNLSFSGLLQVPGGITSTLQQVQDGNGNSTGLSLSSTGASVTTSSTYLASTNGTATPGAIPRLISDGLGDFVNVQNYGTTSGIGTITLSVPSQYATIQAALDSLANKRIIPGSTVTIQVADGTYSIASQINLYHPDGMSIQILGNIAFPSNCTLNFANNGFWLYPGRSLLKIDGFTLHCTAVKTNANSKLGITADGGTLNSVGPNIIVDNFYYGISAWHNGYVDCSGVTVTNSGDVGIWSFIGSFVKCNDATVSGSNDSVNGLGGGIVAEFASSIEANRAITHDNWLCGFSAISGSAIRAWKCNTYNNKNGLIAESSAVIEVFDGATISNNTAYGVYSSDGTGEVYGAQYATMTGNVLGNYFNRFTISNGQTQINSGTIKIDATQPGNVSGNSAYVELNTDNTHFGIIRGLVSGVEKGRIQHSGANGGWQIYSNNSPSFFAYSPSSSVNYVQAEGAIAGQSPNVKAYGSDAVVDLALYGQGVGSYIKLGAGYDNTPITCTGYITVKDNIGTVRRLMVG